jgi:hypothetical protein
MSKKFYLLICVVFVLGLARGAAAQNVRSWWSDLGDTNSWDEPNNWWTMEGENPNWVKSAANSVPDINSDAFIGKGGGWQDYPADLNDLIVGGHIIVDPTIDGTIVAAANGIRVGGGDDLTGNGFVDPCADHYLTVTGGTLTVGANQDWGGDTYERRTDWYEWGMFNGQWASGVLAIGACLSDDVNGTGTMTMSGGVVNVGGHIEVGGWGSVGLLDMTNGTINVFQGVYCTSSWAGETGRINLHGGTINARYLEITDNPYGGNTGVIDVTGGEMILNRDEKDKLLYYEDYNNVGLYGNAISITSYGARHGEIITDSNYAEVGKRAALVIDYDAVREGKTTLAAATPTDPCQAWGPDPPDGAQSVKGPPGNLRRPILSWQPGDGAASHDVYFGPNSADVNSGGGGSSKGNQPTTSWQVDSNLAIAATYYWRIDEVNTVTVTGEVWSFRVGDLAKASYPNPVDGATDVYPTATSWSPGIFAVTHDVYFGPNFPAVNDANTSYSEFMGNQGPNTWDPLNYDSNGLALGTTYYWQIDEVNSGGIPWKGDVWSLTTRDHIAVDNFNGYATTALMKAVWPKTTLGWAEISLELGITVPELIRDGNSMKYYYRCLKSGGSYPGSHIEADPCDLGDGVTDYNLGGVKALWVYFYGLTSNVGSDANALMYLSLDDGTTEGIATYPDGMDKTHEESWHEWPVDLGIIDSCGVDMTSITKVRLGFGGYPDVLTSKVLGPGAQNHGKGDTVYFEDFGLWPPVCISSFAYPYGDLTGNCIINGYDLEIIANEWLRSGQWVQPSPPNAPPELWFKFDVGSGQVATNSGSLGASYNGQLGNTSGADACDPNWITNDPCSERLRCLEFGGVETGGGDHVTSPALNLNTNSVSIAAWVKRDGVQVEWAGMVFCRGPNTLNNEWPSTVTGIGFGGDSKTADRHDLRYHHDDWWWDFESGLTVPNDVWTFVALVVAPDQATLYMSEGETVSSASNVTFHGADAWDAPTFVGGDPQVLSDTMELHRIMKGRIDDVRIYDYSLPISEILALAGSSTLVYMPLDSIADLDVGDKNPTFPYMDEYVNFRDYAILGDSWLKEILFPLE